MGYKKYEITNYLGNVNAVISDRKIYTGGTYAAVMLMNSDYYPFGMQMPGRHKDEDKYRFGYNGMEMDNEAKGNGNSYTTEFRQYDPRLGRWLSLDPLMMQFPWMSPYVAFDDNPIYFVDPYGLSSGTGDPIKIPMKGEIRDTQSEADILHDIAGVDNNQQVTFVYDIKSDKSKLTVTYLYRRDNNGGVGKWNWSSEKYREGYMKVNASGSIDGSIKNSDLGTIMDIAKGSSTITDYSKTVISTQFGISEGDKYKTQGGVKKEYSKSKTSVSGTERLYNKDGSIKNKTLPKSFYHNLKAFDKVLGPLGDGLDVIEILQDINAGRTGDAIQKVGVFILDHLADRLMTSPNPYAIGAGAIIKLALFVYDSNNTPVKLGHVPKPKGGLYQDNLEKEDVVPYLSRMPIMKTR